MLLVREGKYQHSTFGGIANVGEGWIYFMLFLPWSNRIPSGSLYANFWRRRTTGSSLAARKELETDLNFQPLAGSAHSKYLSRGTWIGARPCCPQLFHSFLRGGFPEPTTVALLAR